MPLAACHDAYRGFDLDPSKSADTLCENRQFSEAQRITQVYARQHSLEFRENPLGPVITLIGPRYHFLIDGSASRIQLAQFMKANVRLSGADESDFQNLLELLNTCGR
jgi:hypothetical protein